MATIRAGRLDPTMPATRRAMAKSARPGVGEVLARHRDRGALSWPAHEARQATPCDEDLTLHPGLALFAIASWSPASSGPTGRRGSSPSSSSWWRCSRVLARPGAARRLYRVGSLAASPSAWR